jgi:signal transduction histidine kinase/CheY-like chemotaxis protein
MDTQGRNNILIVDDEKVNLLYLNHILSSDYTIYTARNGKEAITRANDLLPDLILLDILMPEMDGYQTLAELKAAERTRDIPVIFVSGLSSSADEKKGLSLGAADYISKPFSDAIVRLRVLNQIKIVNQMRTLNQRIQQQTLMASISQNLLSGSQNPALFSGALRMIGEVMDLAQILLFKLDGSTLVCQNEWINPDEDADTRIGSRLVLEDSVLAVLNNLMKSSRELFFLSTDPVFNMVMAPYRRNFYNYLIAPVFNKGKICALLDFSKKFEEEEWNTSEQNLAVFSAGVFSAAFERGAIETNLSAVLKLEAELAVAKDRAEQASRAKSGFLAHLANEMRDPVGLLADAINLAQGSGDADKRRESLAKAGGAARVLERLVDDVSDISFLENGKLSLVCQEFNFPFMLHKLFHETDLYRHEKNQTFSATLDPALPEILIGDEKRLSQVIANLLSNAGKFTKDRGSIQVRVFVLEAEKDSVTIQVEVNDNGEGIPREHLVNLFIPFEQMKAGTYPGAGLGLPIAKSIVEMMNGSIWVESEPGKGSQFAFSFKAQTKSLAPKNGSLKTKAQLDGEINRDVTIGILKDAQMQIAYTDDGSDTLELFLPDQEK